MDKGQDKLTMASDNNETGRDEGTVRNNRQEMGWDGRRDNRHDEGRGQHQTRQRTMDMAESGQDEGTARHETGCDEDEKGWGNTTDKTMG